MPHLTRLAALSGLVVVLQGWDLWRTLKTGRANIRWSGTATRTHQPAKYWRYVHQAYAALALFGALALAALLRPGWFA